MCEQLMPIFVVSRLFALLIEKLHDMFWLTVRARKAQGGAVSLEPSLPPLKKITIDLEDEDMQWAVIYNAFASNERAFAQSRQSIFYSH